MDKKIRMFNSLLEKDLMVRLIDLKDKYIETIMGYYDIELTITDPDSKADPQLYRGEFEERLLDFEYFKDEGNRLRFKIPTMDSFDFRGRLGIIKHILEGTVGLYVEVSADDYELMFGKIVHTRDSLDATVPKKELIYLMPYNNIVKKAEIETFKKRYLTPYPYSNTPPFYLFEVGAEFIEKEMDKLVDDSTKDVVKKFKKTA